MNPILKKQLIVAALSFCCAGLFSCSTQEKQTEVEDDDRDPLASYSVMSQMPPEPPYPSANLPDPSAAQSGPRFDKPLTYKGTGKFVGTAGQQAAPPPLAGDALVLNFENADLREVVRTILGDFLKVSYIYDPRVQGTVSLQTTRQLKPDAVLATLETLLRMNGAALVREGDRYRIMPLDEAAGRLAPQLGDTDTPLPPGFRVIIVPLRFISASQMEKLLAPLVSAKTILRVDVERNLLVVAGTSVEVGTLTETIQTFDVDWLAGMSVGLYPLDQVAPETMLPELETIFGSNAEGPLAGLVRFEPISRLNALLVITPQVTYLKRAEEWIRRLDRSSSAEQSLFVYYLQNGKAVELAKILGEIFSEREEFRRDRQVQLAPGRTAVELASRPAGAANAPAAAPPARGGAVRTSESLALNTSSEIRVIADEVNNALLILATPQEHRMVVAAIKKLDIVPLQVLIEATIAEVKLTDDMRFGLQWFFKSGDVTGTFSTGGSGDIASTFPGFSLVAAGVDAKVILDALSSETTINIVSSPHLMVLDNQTASLQVGDEVPVITRQQQSSISADSNLVNTVEYRNTGVIMSVTPRVNAGGSIIMDVEQEVSNVVPSAEETLTPTISQRKFKSSLVVQSGDTVVLGGLIFDFTTKQRQGLPLLSKLPIIGPLFGRTETDDERTELVMLITPRLVRNRYEAKQVTEEVRRRLRALKQLQQESVSTPVWDVISPMQRKRIEVESQGSNQQ
ncbi:MAG: type II secretion system secretin GspD [Gammaproteobacteria bacterium]|nr:type II secretion system secretin GspD [Gammaproteobacteria bacterium]